jgi:hypothetical protein
MVTQYLPQCYPTLFKIQKNPTDQASGLFNTATSQYAKFEPRESSENALRHLGALVEEDFFFLMPSEDGDSFKPKAYISCFPNNFDPVKLLVRDFQRPASPYMAVLFDPSRCYLRLSLAFVPTQQFVF